MTNKQELSKKRNWKMSDKSQQREAEQMPRRILSIDGGGILGTFPAAFLAEMEKDLDHPIGSYFDLIAGTSTGGILAIGLAMGLSASSLLDLYESAVPKFSARTLGRLPIFGTGIAGVRWIFRRKHDSDALRSVLKDVLGERRIGEARTRLLVPAWNPVAQCVYIYKTAHHARLKPTTGASPWMPPLRHLLPRLILNITSLNMASGFLMAGSGQTTLLQLQPLKQSACWGGPVNPCIYSA